MEKQVMLAVDDSAFNRQVLCELFDGEFDVMQASDGVEALAMLHKYGASIAVVLLDIVMPKKDGLDVLRDLQRDEYLKTIPVIVTSSAGDDMFRLKALELGAADYISAPFNPILAKLRVKSALAVRAYDRLRLQTEMLNVQRSETSEYRALLDDSQTAVLEFDASGRVLRYDATIKKELAGTYDSRQLRDIFREDGVADDAALTALDALFMRVTGNDAVLSDSQDMLLRCRNGQHAWFRLRLIKKEDQELGETVLIMSVTNIDAEKREDEATRAQLIHALNAMESASTAKNEFVSRMSHEIRTPLNAIIGYIDIARRSLSSRERMEECLLKADTACKHLLSVVNEVLDLSAADSGLIELRYEGYKLRDMVRSVTAIIYPPVHNKNIQFQISLDGIQEEQLMGDRPRISQILINLLDNAVKFTPQNGNVSLTIRQRVTNTRRVLMDFIVKDDGIGMTHDFITRISNPDTRQGVGGIGLGLSITKRLISLMNGVLSVESVEGRGTTFTVSIPMDVEQPDMTANRPYRFADARVLVIDREIHSAEHARACFRNLGCYCDCTTTGKDALALCVSRAYNLVLMDWKLPDLDGESIMSAIRQAMDEDVTFVVMAYDHSEISMRAVRGTLFLDKPIFPSTVLELMLKCYGEYEMKPTNFIRDEFRGKHMLLVEDNAINTEIATRLLKEMGFEIVATVDGAEACTVFFQSEPGTFDIILMDVQMPEMDGYEATEMIRAAQRPDAQTIPILALTANSFAQDVQEAIARGMNGHIAKPIDYEQVRDTLKRFLLV